MCGRTGRDRTDVIMIRIWKMGGGPTTQDLGRLKAVGEMITEVTICHLGIIIFPHLDHGLAMEGVLKEIYFNPTGKMRNVTARLTNTMTCRLRGMTSMMEE